MSAMIMPLQVVLVAAALFAAASIVVLTATFRWRIPGRYWREGLYSKDPSNYVKAEHLERYRTLMRLYGICFFGWVFVLLAWAVTKN